MLPAGIGVLSCSPGLVFTSQKPFWGLPIARELGEAPPPPAHLHMLLQMAQAAALHVGKCFKLKSCLCFLEGFWLGFFSLSRSGALAHLPSLSIDGAAAWWSRQGECRGAAGI